MADPGRAGPKRWELLLYGVIRAIVVAFSKLFWRVEVKGADKVPARGPFVLAPVHRSNVDFALAANVTSRRMRYMGKDSLWKSKLFGRFISALGAFPVHRGSADREALRRCMDIIERGEPLVMFPEGTRREGPVVQELFDGPAYVAGRTGVPIVPVGIGGSEKSMPRGSKGIRPVKITLIVGDPIEAPAGNDGHVSRRAVKETTLELHGVLQKLFDEAQALAGDPNPSR